jgi:hypothetical protein
MLTNSCNTRCVEQEEVAHCIVVVDGTRVAETIWGRVSHFLPFPLRFVSPTPLFSSSKLFRVRVIATVFHMKYDQITKVRCYNINLTQTSSPGRLKGPIQAW